MKVHLLTHTPNPDDVVYKAATVCYADVYDFTEFNKVPNDDQKKKLLECIIKSGHHSVLEHVSFTFGIDGVSRVLSHQLVRHRIASYSQRSQRYCEEKFEFNYVIPDSISETPMVRQYESLIKAIHSFYEEMIRNGIPKEDARYILPNSWATKLVFTINARSLLNFLELRLCNRAQTEIRELAIKIKELTSNVAPIIMSYAGPICETTGKCKEMIPCKK